MKKTFVSIILALMVTAGFAQEWAPAGNNIKSSWGEQIDPANPLPAYPRPQMVRAEWMNLNGLWNYGVTDAAEEAFAAEGRILVPFAIESSLSGVGRELKKNEALWYEREFTVPKKWKGKNVKLNFDAVDWHAIVYVNGTLVGEHKGGYDGFAFDITPYLKPYCLPDTGHWSVPYTPLDKALFSSWLEAVISSIQDLHLEILLS